MIRICQTFCVFLVVVNPVATPSEAVAQDSLEQRKILSSVRERFSSKSTTEAPDFQKHIVPLLGKLGCNSAKCHGSFQGQGGFRLSLFGFDFGADHASLHDRDSSGGSSRIDVDHANQSLAILKPTEQVDHEGGLRFETGSWEENVLIRWIESGAAGVEAESRMVSSEAEISDDHAKFFRQEVFPVLEDHCFECHGFEQRESGLSVVSLESLKTGGKSGAAIVPGRATESLLWKAMAHVDGVAKMPPSGKLDSNKIAVIARWIDLGAPWPDDADLIPVNPSETLVELHVEPKEIRFTGSSAEQQIRIIAEWSDGTLEDVTCLTRFQTNDDAVVMVDELGVAKSMGRGDTHVVAFYDNGVTAIPVVRPFFDTLDMTQAGQNELVTGAGSANPIDRFINGKLQKLAIRPSELCTDAEFLRRLSIDMTGSLPTPDEVREFLADETEGKRRRKIEELLDRTAYSAWWANKLCDFTGCNPQSIQSLLEVAQEGGYVKATEWYQWIYRRVKANVPYDRLVSELMLADLAGGGDSMPHFWTRQSLKEPKDTAMSVAHAFLGIQLQCAECHKHPFDQWTRSDFSQFSRFFDVVTRTKGRTASDEAQSLELLRSGRVTLNAGADPRKPIVDWMRDPGNPWFARAFVNRVWASYFNTGIVDPPDQFTPANPPSHPELLDWLAQEFIRQGYDMKWLHRQIVTSEAYQRSWKPNETNANDRRNFSRALPRRIPAEVVYDAIKQATAGEDQQSTVRTDLRRRAIGHLSMRMAGTHAMKVFGKPDRSMNCDCERVNEPTLLQAIFTQNDPLVRMRIADSQWVIEIEDHEADGRELDQSFLVDEVWLRTVSRPPGVEERNRAEQHLASVDSISEGVSDLLWALLNTKEFLLNH